jgi:hypothetical protein
MSELAFLRRVGSSSVKVFRTLVWNFSQILDGVLGVFWNFYGLIRDQLVVTVGESNRVYMICEDIKLRGAYSFILFHDKVAS